MRTFFVWLFRLSWAVLALTMGPAVDGALDGRSRSVQIVGTVGAWAFWGVVVAASLVPTTVSLTVIRMTVPAAAVAAAVAWGSGASTVAGAVALGTALVALLLCLSGEVGEAFAQGSAYGHERRLPLRPPGPYLVIVPLAWALLCAAALIGPLALASENWAAGIPLTAVAIPLAIALGRRFHRLSRRWIVLVPAGIVIHDHLVLGETCMVARNDAVSVGLALTGTEAANLTGNALGHALELRMREHTTVVLAAPPRGLTSAIHARSVLLSPTRPGRALREMHQLGVRTDVVPADPRERVG